MAETLNTRINKLAKGIAGDIKDINTKIGIQGDRHQDFKDNSKENIFDCLNYVLTIAKTGASQPSTAIDDGNSTTTTTYSSNKINELLDAIKTKIGSLDNLSTTAKDSVVSSINELKSAIGDINSGWNDKKQELESTMDSKISTAIAAVVDSAPEEFNTFKEIATWIQTNADAITAINNRLKVNEVHALSDDQKKMVWQSIGLGDYDVDFVEVYNQAKA